jgi:predicted nucleotidyltransferase
VTIDTRLSRAFAEQNGFALEPHLLVLALMGSHSHGTYLPPEDPNAVDDVDLMGFVVPPREYHLGLPRWQHWVFQFEELDVVLYSVEKAFRLLLKSNPNIVGLLWLREQEYVYRHELFAELRANRGIFTSRAAAEAFAGYAYDQVKRMEAFDLERMAEYEELTASIRRAGSVEDVLSADSARLKYLSEAWQIPRETLSRFRALHQKYFSGYMGEKRKAMVRKYQYDVKNAAHLIRLLRMGAEFLRSGELQVYRTSDADELKRIKRGGWSLEQVKAEAQRLFAEIETARAESRLPDQPDAVAANALLMRIHQQMIGL